MAWDQNSPLAKSGDASKRLRLLVDTYALGEAERSGLTRTLRRAVIAASRPGGFIPCVRRIKC